LRKIWRSLDPVPPGFPPHLPQGGSTQDPSRPMAVPKGPCRRARFRGAPRSRAD